MCVFVVHEGTLVHAVSVLSQWTSRLTVDVPSELREWFKKAFTLKTSTSPVRHAYLQALIGAFKGESVCWETSDLSSCCWCLVRTNSVCVSVQATLSVRPWTSCLSSSRLWRKLLLRLPSILCCLKAWLPLCCSVGCLCLTPCPVSVHTETDKSFPVSRAGDVHHVSLFSEAKLASFWNLILDEKKPLFSNEKFLSQASEEGQNSPVVE